ncbi:hypothetical protein GHT06_013001 [Daphnia sinensis]|uniref:Uncharacterized protein n=1 Tax=Daphnia sinensis TaxID=1820382 RepID=A0AAD5PW66_9CRUS|nr:hypothetical protein GHT06_013001 [Daphnia sinensis]
MSILKKCEKQWPKEHAFRNGCFRNHPILLSSSIWILLRKAKSEILATWNKLFCSGMLSFRTIEF